ncbi:MAG TPA: hypothetical protein VFG19_02510 [Geobacteraceae bacterium]|nr:hypothetical protein [Geobacteraceae bacterium]
MSTKQWIRKELLTPIIVLAGFVAVLNLAGCNLFSSGGTVQPPSASSGGSLSVQVGFGAVSANAYQCTGQGDVSIAPISLTGSSGSDKATSQHYVYSGFSGLTPPACRANPVSFSGLKQGTWRVVSSNSLGACTANITDNSITTVKISDGVCQ